MTTRYYKGSRNVLGYDTITRILSIGCESHSLSHWLKQYEKIGEQNNYSYADIIEYFGYIKELYMDGTITSVEEVFDNCKAWGCKYYDEEVKCTHKYHTEGWVYFISECGYQEH